MDTNDDPLSFEELAERCRCPVALIRLASDCGLPTKNGQLSFSEFVQWLLHNYPLIRSRAGLPELPSDEGLTGEASARVQFGNVLMTLLDYTKSRSTDPNSKEAARHLAQSISDSMDE